MRVRVKELYECLKQRRRNINKVNETLQIRSCLYVISLEIHLPNISNQHNDIQQNSRNYSDHNTEIFGN